MWEHGGHLKSTYSSRYHVTSGHLDLHDDDVGTCDMGRQHRNYIQQVQQEGVQTNPNATFVGCQMHVTGPFLHLKKRVTMFMSRSFEPVLRLMSLWD